MHFLKKLLLLWLLLPSLAMAWPNKAITIIVPLPPGGIADQIARPIASDLEKKLNVAVIVKNIPGGNHAVAFNSVNSSPDDHTFIMIETGYVSGPTPIEQTKNFIPQIIVGGVPIMLSSNNNVPSDHLQKAIKENKDIVVGNTGADLPHFLWIAGLTSGPKLLPIFYKGGQQTMMDLAGGHIDYAVMSMTLTMQFAEAGRIKPLAIAMKSRHPLIPHIPTYEEIGLKGDPGQVWWGFVAHEKMSEENSALFVQSVKDSLQNNPSIEKLVNTGLVISGLSGLAAQKFLEQEKEKFKKIKQRMQP